MKEPEGIVGGWLGHHDRDGGFRRTVGDGRHVDSGACQGMDDPGRETLLGPEIVADDRNGRQTLCQRYGLKRAVEELGSKFLIKYVNGPLRV